MPDALRDLVEKVLAGDRQAMGRAISVVEGIIAGFMAHRGGANPEVLPSEVQ